MSALSAASSIPEIVAALKSGDALKVERLSRARLSIDMGDTQSMVLLAIALSMLDRNAEVAELYRQLIALEPTEATHHNNLGTALREIGDLAGAEQAYRAALSIDASNASTLANLGTLRWQQGDAVDTRDIMLLATQLDPSLPEPRIYGGLACHECSDTQGAERLVADCEKWPYLGPVLESDLATLLMQLARSEEAERRLRSAIERPEAAQLVRLRLAGLLERLNRLDEAESMLEGAQLSELDKDEELSVRGTLAVRRGKFDDAIGFYRASLKTNSDDITKAPQWFSLAKACDSAKDTTGAMQALEKAHSLQMKQAARLVPRLMEPDSNPLSITEYKVDAEGFGRWKADPGAPDSHASPIFIVGFPRSGTTLLEQMLDAHPGVRSMDERAFLQNVIKRMQGVDGKLYPDDLDRLEPGELEQLRGVYWECVKDVVQLETGERLVDKNPLNILRLPIIHRIFPNARIVLALRHPCDVILSNYMQSFRAPEYQVLCSSLQRLARGYSNAMNFWNHHARVFSPAILDLRYEDLLDDVAAQTRRISEHLGLTDAAALEKFQERARAKGFISTPSYSQVVEPLNKKAVGRWQRYRQHLEPVLPTLEPFMKQWNYEA
ncbi:tetratricopeptide repeat-containing sulfotransferase family protein [Dokdonella immobilis]|uniref:Tetratricopeptide repeat-containing protein n=1 Tax=Dokdonella immobilis TaxID=578942 RepID=A0A1I4W6L6_9GAMM|nr:tetratricopeptide repeat-containing sulfotransferase family protein [Dokdonella immobilis]SFN09113.1 Tetratricopeptide repeat-containing protein [Dokdonella immobilis]